MSDILRLNGNSKRLKIKVQNPGLNEYDSNNKIEDNYIQTNLQNYYDRGYTEGRETAKDEIKREFEKKINEVIEKFGPIIEKIENQAAGYGKIFESLVIKLSFMIAEKLIRSELSNKSIIKETLQNSLKKVIGSNNIIVKLNPDDLKTLNEKSNRVVQQGDLSQIKFEPDDSIEPGGCYVETEIGNVDARISTQLDELEKLLKETL